MNKPDLSSSSTPLFTDVLSSLSEALADLSDPELLWASSSRGLGDRDLLLAGLGDRDPATDWFLTGLGEREPETRNAVLPIIFQHTNLPVTMIQFTCTVGCPESIRPFWVSQKPVMWPWCNLAASQRRPYCASVNSHPPVGLVSRQWDAADWAGVLCDRRIHKSPPFQQLF